MRPAGALDMPNELLTATFSHLKNTADIQSARLTCRRFEANSSRFLIPLVRVEPQSASLRRLDRISQHPAIGGGVREVAIQLTYYDATLAFEIADFTSTNAERVESEKKTLLWLISHSCLPPGVSRQRGEAAVDRADAIMDSWENAGPVTPENLSPEEDQQYQDLLNVAFDKYRSRYLNQAGMLEDGTFIRAVAAAMAQMPRARTLAFHGKTELTQRQEKHFLFRMEDLKEQCEVMTYPLSREQARFQLCGPRVGDLFITLPLAVHKAGVLLSELNISTYLTLEEDLPELETSKITSALQGLRAVNLDFMWDELPNRSYVHHICSLLNAILDTDSLQSISLSFDCEFDTRPLLFTMGTILTRRKWKNLRRVSLSNMPLHLRELALFIANLGAPLEGFHIDAIHLLSGTWAEGLDIFRGSVGMLGGDRIEVRDPSGAEVEIKLSNDETNAMFEGEGGRRSTAEAYILGYTYTNPLQGVMG